MARVVRRIPRGTTLGYGEVALRAGKPRAARLAVRALHRIEGIPWWRVARSNGTLAPQVAFEQEQLLRAEGWRGPPGSHRKPYRQVRQRKVQQRRGRVPRTSE